jgi:hypothetical protein
MVARDLERSVRLSPGRRLPVDPDRDRGRCVFAGDGHAIYRLGIWAAQASAVQWTIGPLDLGGAALRRKPSRAHLRGVSDRDVCAAPPQSLTVTGDHHAIEPSGVPPLAFAFCGTRPRPMIIAAPMPAASVPGYPRIRTPPGARRLLRPVSGRTRAGALL